MVILPFHQQCLNLCFPRRRALILNLFRPKIQNRHRSRVNILLSPEKYDKLTIVYYDRFEIRALLYLEHDLEHDDDYYYSTLWFYQNI